MFCGGWDGYNPAPGDFVYPTMGFDLDEDILTNNFNVKIFGLGGADGIRGYWPNYYDDVCGGLAGSQAVRQAVVHPPPPPPDLNLMCDVAV